MIADVPELDFPPEILFDDDLAQAYAETERGASVRDLRLADLTPKDAHHWLAALGFDGRSVPLVASRTRENARQYLLASRVETPDPKVPTRAFENVYVHPDGGVVRMFAAGASSFGLALRQPCIRKSVLRVTPRLADDFSLDAEAFAVDERGRPIPKSPRVEHGVLRGDPATMRARGVAAVHGARVKLKPGEAIPLPVLEEGRGLEVGRTLVPQGDFFEACRVIESLEQQRWVGAAVSRIEEATKERLLFTGDPTFTWEWFAGYDALASLTISKGTYTLGLDPVGHPASVEQMVAFVKALLAVVPCRVLDDRSGEDVTQKIQRFPSALFAASHRYPEPAAT